MANTFVTLSAFIALCLLGASAERSSRILDGDDVASGKYPWAASVRVDNIHVCGGSIIGAKYILTAAHCVADINPSRLSVRVGSSNQFAGGILKGVAAINIHPDFAYFLNDLALLQLSNALTWSQKVASIALPEADDVLAEGTVITVAGWGLLKSGATPYKMQETRFTALSPSECELQAGYGYNSTVCMQRPVNNGICNGDYGAGCVTDEKLVGVAGFAFGGCGTKFPDVAMLVSYAREWINSVIA